MEKKAKNVLLRPLPSVFFQMSAGAAAVLLLLATGCASRGTSELPHVPSAGVAAPESTSSHVQIALEQGAANLELDTSGNAFVRGRVVGAENDYYTVTGEAGDTLKVALLPSNKALYFEVLRTGNLASMFRGGDSGEYRWEGGLPADETYLIRIYLYPSTVRYNERSDYTLRVQLKPPMLGGKPRR